MFTRFDLLALSYYTETTSEVFFLVIFPVNTNTFHNNGDSFWKQLVLNACTSLYNLLNAIKILKKIVPAFINIYFMILLPTLSTLAECMGNINFCLLLVFLLETLERRCFIEFSISFYEFLFMSFNNY